MSRPEIGNRLTGNYADDRSARNAEVINEKTAAAQEIGPLPPVADSTRRADCSQNLELFCREYFAATFFKGFSPYQIDMIRAFENGMFEGGKKTRAVRRGGLKSTLARVAAIWAVVNGIRTFVVLVGATDSKANEHRRNFFDMLKASELLLQDYPELLPLLLKKKQPKKQYRLNGQLLELSPKDDKGRIVFPDIANVPSCQAHVAPYSLKSTDVSGLSFVDREGVTRRPDCLIFDDVQTPQSARSAVQTDEREELITKTFCGLAGLGEKLAAIMVCTVREHDDLTQRFLDRERHPDWDGQKYPSLIHLPERMDLWDRYGDLLSTGDTPEEGKRRATAFLRQYYDEMHSGGVVAWEDDKQEDELSGLQSMMTIRALDPEFFECEIQQEGAKPINSAGLLLSDRLLAERLSNLPRGVLPDDTTTLTGFVDSQDNVLFWMVVAWRKDFSGFIVDYGTYPEQGRALFTRSGDGLPVPFSKVMPELPWEEQFVSAHNVVEQILLHEIEWRTETGERRQVDMLLKDWGDGDHKTPLTSQILSSPDRSRIRASKGEAKRPGSAATHDRAEKHAHLRTTRRHWVEDRKTALYHAAFDANIWKTFVARRLLVVPGAPSAIMLPGTDQRENKLLVQHLTAEVPEHVTVNEASGIMWKGLPRRDNDWWDCLVGNAVAASMMGVALEGEKTEQKRARRKIKLPGGAR